MEDKKYCPQCENTLPLIFFGVRHKKKIDGSSIFYIRSWCNPCLSKRTKEWKAKNIEKWKLYHRNYWRKNREKINKYQRAYFHKHKEE